jgi:hypothetical protein
MIYELKYELGTLLAELHGERRSGGNCHFLMDTKYRIRKIVHHLPSLNKFCLIEM